MNVKQADEELFKLLKESGQNQVTFAPETTENLRPYLGKGYIKDDKLIFLATLAKKYDFSLNLYALGFLPGEDDTTIRDFAVLIRKIRKAFGYRNSLYVHYNPVFSKAQTPYQYLGNPLPKESRRKLALLQSELRDCEVKFVSVIPNAITYYQPVLSMGDFNSGKVLAYLYKKNRITENDWRRAFRELGFDDTRYFRTKDLNKRLPWNHIVFANFQDHIQRALSLQKASDK